MTFVVAAGLGLFQGCTTKTGYVRVATPGTEVRIRTGWGRTVKITHESGPVALSTGTYRPAGIRLVARESPKDAAGPSAGPEWTLSSDGPFGKLERIVVAEGKTTVLEFGPPLSGRVRTMPSAHTIGVGFDIVGRAGESYPPAARRNGRRQPPPKVRILDDRGKLLEAGSFAYG